MTTVEKLHSEGIDKARFDWFAALRFGLLGGVIALFLCLVGLISTFGEVDIIGEVVAFGHVMLILTILAMGYLAARSASPGDGETPRADQALFGAAIAGLLGGGIVALLVVTSDAINLRAVLISVSPELIDLLRFNQGTGTGILLLMTGSTTIGVLGGAIYLLPVWARSSLAIGLSTVVLLGLLRDIWRVVFSGRPFLKPVSDFIFASAGLTKQGALVLFVLLTGFFVVWRKTSDTVRELMRRTLTVGTTTVLLIDWLTGLRTAPSSDDQLSFLEKGLNTLLPPKGLTIQGAAVLFVIVAGITIVVSLKTMGRREKEVRARLPFMTGSFKVGDPAVMRWVNVACGVILLLILPFFLRNYLNNVADTVGRFILMGLGLNIVVGFAGMLDLGYVAFYAIGAYTMGVLTTGAPDLATAQFTFWAALPLAIGVSVLAGFMLGVPVLKMRGDYLAIVTLGFGEIIAKLAISDWLRPYIGGAQGILQIPRPSVLGKELVTFQNLYYLILILVGIALFISWRLRDSRAGRAWMALREDEDVAEAMGIDLVKTKLMAFAIGAGFAGAGGAFFASQVGSAFPHSFNLIISIQVLSLIIVGGIGSLPGVIVGSLFLVGLPEIMSELQQYRFLFFGAALVVMMLVRPEGLWPEATRKRELHWEENDEPVSDIALER